MPHQCPTNDEGRNPAGFAAPGFPFVIGGALVGHSSLSLLLPSVQTTTIMGRNPSLRPDAADRLMAIEFSCPHCRHLYRLPDALAGKRATCKNAQCRQVIVVPSPATVPPTAPPPIDVEAAA